MARHLNAQGLQPDVIVAHPGWGESLFLKDVWPGAKLGIYCEYFYGAEGGDLAFDPEFTGNDEDGAARMRMKNVNNLLHFEVADAGLAPTRWQASTFPQRFRERISVVHDGIDTQALVPRPQASLTLNGRVFTRADEIVTFVTRNLEPYRGYHVFMRALPQLMRERPAAQVLIVGGTAAGYGGAPAGGGNWRDIFLEEVRPRLPQQALERIHFLGNVPYEHFVGIMQLSSVHVYLTYPFVLSWSLLEAMSMGCAVVASDTAPVREAIEHGVTGRLVDFFDAGALASEVAALLSDEPQRARLGSAARQHVVANYDLARVCLPGQMQWVEGLVRAG